MNNAKEISCRWLCLLKLISFENDTKSEAKSSAGNSLMIFEEHDRRLFGVVVVEVGWERRNWGSYSTAEICFLELGTRGPAFSKRGGNTS